MSYYDTFSTPIPNNEKKKDTINRLLKSFKWEFGNQRHIRLRSLLISLESQRKRKNVDKKRVDELEKLIISSLENKSTNDEQKHK